MTARPTFRVYVVESYRQTLRYSSGAATVESRGVVCDVYKERLFLHLFSLADYQLVPRNLVTRHGVRNPKARMTLLGAEDDRWWFSKGPSTAHWPGIRAVRCRWNVTRPEALFAIPANANTRHVMIVTRPAGDELARKSRA
jgi:hypothetical protein